MLFGLVEATEVAIRKLADSSTNSGRVGNSWWIAFTVDDDESFRGSILHIHIATPEDWASAITDIQNWTVVAGGAASAIALTTALTGAAVIPILAVAWQFCTNKDGTYDFYMIKESKPWVKKWRLGFVYSTWISFTGFVSDAGHKPPMSFNPYNTMKIANYPRIKRIAKIYRNSPKPR